VVRFIDSSGFVVYLIIILVLLLIIYCFFVQRYVGEIVLLSQEQPLQRYNRGVPLVYLVYFPVTSPLPRITSLTVNGQELCYSPVREYLIPQFYNSYSWETPYCPVTSPGPLVMQVRSTARHIIYLQFDISANDLEIRVEQRPKCMMCC
jgi:hypothetical protein